MPTLRRPATSHQRTVTLQQQFKYDEPVLNTASFQQTDPAGQVPQQDIIAESPTQHVGKSWQPYFESRQTKVGRDRLSTRSCDSIDAPYPIARRVILPDGSTPPTLLKAALITESNSQRVPSWMDTFPMSYNQAGAVIDSSDRQQPTPAQGFEEEPQKRPRRSLSMPLGGPSNWMPRSGGLRLSKRGGNSKSSGKRYASAPLTTVAGRATTIITHETHGTNRRVITDPDIFHSINRELEDSHDSHSPFPGDQSQARSSPSPLPSLSRLSSFNLDLSRLGLSSSSSNGPRNSPKSSDYAGNPGTQCRTTPSEVPFDKSSPRVVIHQSRSPRIPELTASDRASTLVGSDSDNRGFGSGEEDEMDFQSDTVFDSYRTGTTGSLRSRNTPLELMFDESPPSIGHKINATIVREMTMNGPFRDSIVEEDEDMTTPIKDRTNTNKDRYTTLLRESPEGPSYDAISSSPPRFPIAAHDFARLSIEDDEDEEDWTKDDDSMTISNPLSPPSSSLKSRRVTSTGRTALADVTKSISAYGNAGLSEERPKSVFDWSEPLVVEKDDLTGNATRPKTVHGKQIIDLRGGRTAGRRGPIALHVRSQSVPVVPDVAGRREHSKLTPKFGTWGLGGKGVNEDWDNDFEFDGMDDNEKENGNDSMSGSGMLVPPAIQASHANVVGHVGQIREICMLVEDLKRLRSLGLEKGLLNGSSSALWREAEGIIALAIPDEEDATLSPIRTSSSFAFDSETLGDNYRDGGFDLEELGGDDVPNGDSSGHSRHTGRIHDGTHVRRKSVFSPEDDIFGVGGAAAIERLGVEQVQSFKPTFETSSKSSTDVARVVMEHIHQHRAISDPFRSDVAEPTKKMPFDTTSLRDLVQRAKTLSHILAEVIRKSDSFAQSPAASPQVERESSPAFTRVFTDPLACPPRHITRSESNNSILSGSFDSSPTRGLGKRMQLMTVV